MNEREKNLWDAGYQEGIREGQDTMLNRILSLIQMYNRGVNDVRMLARVTGLKEGEVSFILKALL